MMNLDLQGTPDYATKVFKGECPNCECGIKIESLESNTINLHEENEKIINIFECPSCDEIILQVWDKHYNDRFELSTTYPSETSITEFSEEIKTVSEKFIEIYNEAEIAENNRLLNICGPGYRKALEFLIKDYIIMENPDKEDEVKKTLLSPCISKFIKDEMLKDIAERATWLGNDETHYIRIWQDKDLSDMKGFIKQVIYSIENKLQYEKMKQEMPKNKK